MSEVSWKAAWTGGQYSFVRAAAAGLLTCLLIKSSFGEDGFSWFSATLAVASAALTLGYGGRALTVVFATLVPFGTGDWGDSTAGTIAGLWLFLHLGLPPAPFGSLAARGRQDPGGTWTMPAWYPFCCQALFVLTRFGYGMQAMMEGHPWLAALFVVPGVLALGRRSALLAWSLSLGVEVSLALSGNGSLGAAFLLHLLAFQPAWIPRRQASGVATVFYDGSCALCHGCVRFLLAEDVAPAQFRLAPLGGPTFLARVPERIRITRPDSILVVRTSEAHASEVRGSEAQTSSEARIGSEVLVRGAAALEILDALGGLWCAVATVLHFFPQGVIDSAYDAVASRRYAWFGRKADACPLMTPEQRLRFDP